MGTHGNRGNRGIEEGAKIRLEQAWHTLAAARPQHSPKTKKMGLFLYINKGSMDCTQGYIYSAFSLSERNPAVLEQQRETIYSRVPARFSTAGEPTRSRENPIYHSHGVHHDSLRWNCTSTLVTIAMLCPQQMIPELALACVNLHYRSIQPFSSHLRRRYY